MIRTQIYLPEETHSNLLRLAKSTGTNLSQLIRQGAQLVLKKHYGLMSPQQKALKALLDYPDKDRLKLSDSPVKLVRQERD